VPASALPLMLNLATADMLGGVRTKVHSLVSVPEIVRMQTGNSQMSTSAWQARQKYGRLLQIHRPLFSLLPAAPPDAHIPHKKVFPSFFHVFPLDRIIA